MTSSNAYIMAHYLLFQFQFIVSVYYFQPGGLQLKIERNVKEKNMY